MQIDKRLENNGRMVNIFTSNIIVLFGYFICVIFLDGGAFKQWPCLRETSTSV